MSLKHAILGFLSIKALTGYELKKAFDRSVEHFWPADQSQIYRTLSKLVDEGLLTVEEIPVESRLNQKRYHITEAGSENLIQWLSRPLADHESREPFLIQIFFASLLPGNAILPILEKAIEIVRQRIDELENAFAEITRDVKKTNKKTFFPIITLEYGIVSHKTTLEWLRSVHERLKKGDLSPRRF